MITDPRDEDLVGKFIWVMVEYRDGSSIVERPRDAPRRAERHA